MIHYLDASALVKRYVAESGSRDVIEWIVHSDLTATSLITRVEVAAALARAKRMGQIPSEEAMNALSLFRAEWADIHRLPVNEATVSRGDALAYEFGLRGFDAVHLATALIWQESLGLPVTIVTFDRQLREAGGKVGLLVLPQDSPSTG